MKTGTIKFKIVEVFERNNFDNIAYEKQKDLLRLRNLSFDEVITCEIIKFENYKETEDFDGDFEPAYQILNEDKDIEWFASEQDFKDGLFFEGLNCTDLGFEFELLSLELISIDED